MSDKEVENRWLQAADDLLGRIASILLAARSQVLYTRIARASIPGAAMTTFADYE